MKQIKLFLVAAAVLLSIGGALATKPVYACQNFKQYYFNGSVYIEAGVYGVTYYCYEEYSGTCTYYRPNPLTQPNVYLPCRTGLFAWIQ